MEHKQSSVRQYDPAKPRRAKNLRDRDWEPMKATITEGHELGHTRTQILQSLEKRHKFFASPAQLNKQMARWGLRVKGKGRAAIEGEAGYWACEHMSASPAASEAADQKKSSASLHSREVQSSVDARATTLEAAADQLGRPCDAAAINQVDITAKQKANSSFDSTIRSQHGHCRDAASQNPQASIWKPDIEMSSEIVDGELPSNPFSTIMRMIREYRPSDAATKLLKTANVATQS
ncbi:hypothetical protein H2200_011900 [Cladophialophora chaetospira]|uniref:Clr5 domain-containing protein n=1 Tax=Cladophialophora chaetospira TaxID=386627 RepID=A0AA38WYY8_9EURO|nr:hypothetical protein H2200_011900 [Cladophialophora chaetospira]